MIPCIFLRDKKYIVVYNEWTYIEKQEAVGADIQYCGVSSILIFFFVYLVDVFLYLQP